MSQRNSQRHADRTHRPATIVDALQLRGSLSIALVLVLLISNGGAG